MLLHLPIVVVVVIYSDGRGGGEGGCQRMEPELSWADNTNLTYAHQLLEPIKQKYGIGLSWGDLMVLAGTVAIEDMGGPVLGFAAGRIDHIDNSQTIGLGPSEEQEKFAHIEVDGQAPAPLGQNTMGLIYVNPAGPMGVPDPQGAADVSWQSLHLCVAIDMVASSRIMISHLVPFLFLKFVSVDVSLLYLSFCHHFCSDIGRLTKDLIHQQPFYITNF